MAYFGREIASGEAVCPRAQPGVRGCESPIQMTGTDKPLDPTLLDIAAINHLLAPHPQTSVGTRPPFSPTWGRSPSHSKTMKESFR
jgi:hypothetical protein